MTDLDRSWFLRVARGEIEDGHALQAMVWTVDDWRHRDPELAAAFDEGRRNHPDNPRWQPNGPPPWERDIDVDPAAMEAFELLVTEENHRLLLDELHDQLTRYVAFPSPEAADAVTLFAAATHVQPCWEHATRLVIKSPVKRCGKTRLLEVLMEVCENVLATANCSVAALTRSIGVADPPSIVLDEADTVFATRRGERSESAEDLRGILNAGHARGWPYLRWDPAKRQREECATFAMAIVAGIGDMPDTIEDRAVVITMRRRAPGEQVERFRRRRSVPPLRDIRDRVHEWLLGHVDELHQAEPELPVEDRAADVWEPLVAVADLAGGDWPTRARRACIALTPDEATDDSSSTNLLADIHEAFDGADKIGTTTLLERLNGDETKPWGGWHRGDGFNARDLAKHLKPYGIRPRPVRVGTGRWE